MTSINSNISAMAALQTLRNVNNALVDTQNKVSSGYRVAIAKDDAAYWSIATTMRSDSKALATVGDTISLAQALVDVTYSGLESVLTQMNEIKSLFVTAQGMPAVSSSNPNISIGDFTKIFDGSDLAKIDSTIDQLAMGIWTSAKSSSFNGVNLLINPYNESETTYHEINFVTGYANGSVQTISLSRSENTLYNSNLRNFPTGSLGSFGILDSAINTDDYYFSLPSMGYQIYFGEGQDVPLSSSNKIIAFFEYEALTNASASREELYRQALNSFDNRIASVVSMMSKFGSIKSSLDTYGELNKIFKAALDTGVGRLVDANMEEESAKLSAIQSQRQLAIQSLQIANDSPKHILSLFN